MIKYELYLIKQGKIVDFQLISLKSESHELRNLLHPLNLYGPEQYRAYYQIAESGTGLSYSFQYTVEAAEIEKYIRELEIKDF